MFSCARDGLLGFPMAGFRPSHGLNAYSCGTAGIFTPFPHPKRMGTGPLALRTLSSVCSIVWLYPEKPKSQAKSDRGYIVTCKQNWAGWAAVEKASWKVLC